jgi:molybdenum cofactor cytidylyltransferase
MPRVTADEINQLIVAFNPLEGRAICVPTHLGKRGNPVLWAHRFFEEMRHLHGDVGARHLIGEYSDVVAEIEMEADGVLLDIDTPEKLSDVTASDLG